MTASPTEASEVSTPRSPSLLGFDFESWRVGVMRGLIVTSALVVTYWVLWLADRGIVASDHTAQYIAFEQSFPLADAWLLTALLVTCIQVSRRSPSALVWVFVAGGAGMYLCAMDVLYDLEHGIYAKGHGGAIELAINLLTATSSIGIMAFGWRFRYALFGTSTDDRPAGVDSRRCRDSGP
jgi:hypothetical protein